MMSEMDAFLPDDEMKLFAANMPGVPSVDALGNVE
jgi:hypothetical protein